MRARVAFLAIAAAFVLYAAASQAGADRSGAQGPGLAGAACASCTPAGRPRPPPSAYLPLACRSFELVRTATPTATPSTTASLLVGKLVDQDRAPPGSVLQYTLVVMNDMLSGEDPGASVTLEDALPEELELAPGSLHAEAEYDAITRTVRWTGRIARGSSIGLGFQALMTSLAATMGSVVNTVIVTDAFGRVRQASAQIHVVPPTPTDTPVVPTATQTPTPTSMPGPPILYEPADGAVLPQPVSSNEWYFSWGARAGPCCCYISISGPGGRQFGASCIPFYPTMRYEYRYSSTEYLPDDALGPWRWAVAVVRPLGTNYSESRSFWAERAPAPMETPILPRP